MHRIVTTHRPIFKDLTFYGGMSSVDAGNDKYVVEYKYRDNSPHYPDGTMLEKKKLDNMKLLSNGKRQIFYIIQSDNKIWFFHINKIHNELIWEQRKCKKTTAFKDNNYIDKEIAIIPWELASGCIDLYGNVVDISTKTLEDLIKESGL